MFNLVFVLGHKIDIYQQYAVFSYKIIQNIWWQKKTMYLCIVKRKEILEDKNIGIVLKVKRFVLG